MESTHIWRRKEDAVDRGESGHYIECDGCYHRIFIPKKWNDFQVKLDIIMYFMEVVNGFKLSEEMIVSLSISDEYGMDVGIHGVLSYDCNAAKEFPNFACVIEVMGV